MAAESPTRVVLDTLDEFVAQCRKLDSLTVQNLDRTKLRVQCTTCLMTIEKSPKVSGNQLPCLCRKKIPAELEDLQAVVAA